MFTIFMYYFLKLTLRTFNIFCKYNQKKLYIKFLATWSLILNTYMYYILLKQYELNVRMLHAESFAFQNLWCPLPKVRKLNFLLYTHLVCKLFLPPSPSYVSGKYFNGTVLEINFDLIFILLNLI
jgi:hypothetical protein